MVRRNETKVLTTVSSCRKTDCVISGQNFSGAFEYCLLDHNQPCPPPPPPTFCPKRYKSGGCNRCIFLKESAAKNWAAVGCKGGQSYLKVRE